MFEVGEALWVRVLQRVGGGGNVGKLTVPSELSLGRNIVLVLLHCDCWSFETD